MTDPVVSDGLRRLVLANRILVRGDMIGDFGHVRDPLNKDRCRQPRAMPLSDLPLPRAGGYRVAHAGSRGI